MKLKDEEKKKKNGDLFNHFLSKKRVWELSRKTGRRKEDEGKMKDERKKKEKRPPFIFVLSYSFSLSQMLSLLQPNLASIGQTPLSLGCYNGHVSVVRLLLKDPRVDVTLEDYNGRTPLWRASCYGRHEVIECLTASGRDLGDIRNKKGKFDGKEYTALEIARERNKTESVSVLERFEAKPSLTRQEIRNSTSQGLFCFHFHFHFHFHF